MSEEVDLKNGESFETLNSTLRNCVSIIFHFAFVVLATQSCLTLGNPMDYSPPGSSVHGILQVRILEWVAIPSYKGSFWPKDRGSPASLADSLPSKPQGSPYLALHYLERLVQTSRRKTILQLLKHKNAENSGDGATPSFPSSLSTESAVITRSHPFLH